MSYSKSVLSISLLLPATALDLGLSRLKPLRGLEYLSDSQYGPGMSKYALSLSL